MADSRLNAHAMCKLGSSISGRPLGNRRRPIELLLAAAGGSCSLCEVQSADMKTRSLYLHKASMARALFYSNSGRKYPCI